MTSTNPIETATQTTVIEGLTSYGQWEVLPEGVFTGPDQARDAIDAFDSLVALGGDYTADTMRIRSRLSR
jgi:hypothetical protein